MAAKLVFGDKASIQKRDACANLLAFQRFAKARGYQARSDQRHIFLARRYGLEKKYLSIEAAYDALMRRLGDAG